MSFFPRGFIDEPATSFHPLFRLLDDFENYRRAAGPQRNRGQARQTFNPKFDVKEIAEGYELHGELPGVEQKDVEIEFTDPQTLTIRGRTERSYTSGTPPAGLVEGSNSGRITEGGETANNHKATVEDEDAANNKETTAVSTEQAQQPKEPEARFWVSERSVGEFARTFSFPARIDQDAVTASMKNGILSIVVPKAKKAESRKITIS